MRLLALEYGISTACIGQVADERQWSGDLANLDKSTLDGKLDAKNKITENLVVDVNARIRTDTILRHRADIALVRRFAMLGELEITTGGVIFCCATWVNCYAYLMPAAAIN